MAELGFIELQMKVKGKILCTCVIIIIIIIIDKFSIFKNFKTVAAEDLTLLDVPILEDRVVDNALKDKIATLERLIKRLSTLQSQ